MTSRTFQEAHGVGLSRSPAETPANTPLVEAKACRRRSALMSPPLVRRAPRASARRHAHLKQPEFTYTTQRLSWPRASEDLSGQEAGVFHRAHPRGCRREVDVSRATRGLLRGAPLR